jgi:hypothetical protein
MLNRITDVMQCASSDSADVPSRVEGQAPFIQLIIHRSQSLLKLQHKLVDRCILEEEEERPTTLGSR